MWARRHPRVDREHTLRAIVESLRHPAVPRRASDLAYKVATDSDAVGVRCAHKACTQCPGTPDSVEHKYHACPRTRRVWELVLRAWEALTGEQLDASDPWVTLWGLGPQAWEDGAKPRPPAREEVWQVVHKSTLLAIHEMWRRPARKAHHVYQRVQTLVQQMASDRRSRLSPDTFESLWVETGAAVLAGTARRLVTAGLWSHKRKRVPGPVQASIWTDGSGGKPGL